MANFSIGTTFASATGKIGCDATEGATILAGVTHVNTHSDGLLTDQGDTEELVYTGSLLQKDPSHAYPYLAVVSLSLVLGVFGNIMIIGAHIVYKKLQTSANSVIINLALADLCVAGVADPMCILGVVKGKEFFDKHPMFCELIACFCLTACFCAFLSLGFFTLSKYMFLCHNNTYHKVFGYKTVVMACVIIWITALGLEMPNFFGWGDHYFDQKNHQCIWDRRASIGYTYFLAIVLVMSPLLLMVVGYTNIFWTILSSKKRVLKHSGLEGFKLIKEEWTQTLRCCRTMFIVVIFFIICWFPYAIIIMIDMDDRYPMWVHLWTTFLAHFHSVVNFFIYLITNSEYRKGFAMLLCRGKRRQTLYSARDHVTATKKETFSTSQAYTEKVSIVSNGLLGSKEESNVQKDVEESTSGSESTTTL